MSVRTTIAFEEDLLKLLKLKAVEVSTSVSQLVNDMMRDAFSEDSEDLQAFAEREHEETIGFEAFLSELKADGKV